MAKKKAKKKTTSHSCGIDLSPLIAKLTHLKVTKRHIEEGVKGDASQCAIALAIQDELEGTDLSYEDVSVDSGGASFALIVPRADTTIKAGKQQVVACSEDDVYLSVSVDYGKKGADFVYAFDEDKSKAKPTTFAGKTHVSI